MWNDLTMQQRADVISMAVKAGMRDMKSIRSFYDETLGSRRFDDGGKKITVRDNGRATISSPGFFVNTDIDSAIDMAERMGDVQNLLPEVTVTGYRPIELRTYYPGGGQYPLTGHSSLVIPISDKVRDKYGMNSTYFGTTEPQSLDLVVDKMSNAEDYNLVTNNCADATLGYLNTMFHKKESPLLFTTPGDVRDFALNKLGGKKVFRDGVETILIPRNSKNADLLSTRAIERFANEPDDNYRTTRYRYHSNKKAFGGHLLEDGGSTKDTTPGMTGMMKATLATAAHFGNPTARRMTNYDTRSYIWPNEYIEDGIFMKPQKGNVYVASYDNLVTPQIQDTGKGLTFVNDVWAPENEQRSYSQSLKFNNEEDARYFGEHYKEIAPMMHLYGEGEGIKKY